MWAFVYSKDKNIPQSMAGKFGAASVWTWTALDADTKLTPCWMVGSRDGDAADAFMQDLAGRLANRVQLSIDGHKAYLNAVEGAFRNEIDYAMLVKIYGNAPQPDTRYSPAECIGCREENVRR